MSSIANLGSQFGPIFYGNLSKQIMNPNNEEANIIIKEGSRYVRYFGEDISAKVTHFFGFVAVWSAVVAVVVWPIIPNPDGMVSLLSTYISNLFTCDKNKKKNLSLAKRDNELVLRKSIESMRSSFSSAVSSHSPSYYSYSRKESLRNYSDKIRSKKSMTSETSKHSKITEKISKKSEHSIKKSEKSKSSKDEGIVNKIGNENYELKEMLLDYMKYDKEDINVSVNEDNEHYQQNEKRSNAKETDVELNTNYANTTPLQILQDSDYNYQYKKS